MTPSDTVFAVPGGAFCFSDDCNRLQKSFLKTLFIFIFRGLYDILGLKLTELFGA